MSQRHGQHILRHPFLQKTRRELAELRGPIPSKIWKAVVEAVLETFYGELQYDLDSEDDQAELSNALSLAVSLSSKLPAALPGARGEHRTAPAATRRSYEKPRQQRTELVLYVEAVKILAQLFGYTARGEVFWEAVARGYGQAHGVDITREALSRRYYRGRAEVQRQSPAVLSLTVLRQALERELDKARKQYLQGLPQRLAICHHAFFSRLGRRLEKDALTTAKVLTAYPQRLGLPRRGHARRRSLRPGEEDRFRLALAFLVGVLPDHPLSAAAPSLPPPQSRTATGSAPRSARATEAGRQTRPRVAARPRGGRAKKRRRSR